MKRALLIIGLAFTTACAGNAKACSQFSAQSFGSDWIVVQFAQDGHAFNCWKLHGAAVGSSEGGNVDWQDRVNGHLVHITGWENRVQVVRGDFEGAAALVGVDATRCNNGVYPSVK